MYKKSPYEHLVQADLNKVDMRLTSQVNEHGSLIDNLQAQITDLRSEINDLKDAIKEAKADNGSN